MSRSFKKHPVIKSYNEFTQLSKKLANKRVRRAADVSDGCNYKRFYAQYDICEHRSYLDPEAIKDNDRISERKFYQK